MGLFVYFRGLLECVRCRRMTDAWIQTKLLRHQADNSCQEYRVGDTEALVGLDDYCPLHPWDGDSPLVVAVGDWGCSYCSLNWQWARIVLEVQPDSDPPAATIRDLCVLRPWRPADLASIHFVEPDLAELSDLWGRGSAYNWQEGMARWMACLLQERCERLAAGFGRWSREVAGIDTGPFTAVP